MEARLTLDEAMVGIVLPAVQQVLRGSELRSITLWWGETEILVAADVARVPTPCIELTLDVSGEAFRGVVYDERSGPHVSLDELTARLTSNLVDFVAESAFAWGQDRSQKP